MYWRRIFILDGVPTSHPRCRRYRYWYMCTVVMDRSTPHITHTLRLERLSGSRTCFDVISRRMTYLISRHLILHSSTLSVGEDYSHPLRCACPVFPSHDKTIEHFQWQHADWWRRIRLIHTEAGTREVLGTPLPNNALDHIEVDKYTTAQSPSHWSFPFYDMTPCLALPCLALPFSPFPHLMWHSRTSSNLTP